ncbi:MAG TPA: hypothetical protein PL074_06515, partial [Thermoflexales bacterium]|nr:hypothetical protein [Thermoflexales bacterium]
MVIVATSRFKENFVCKRRAQLKRPSFLLVDTDCVLRETLLTSLEIRFFYGDHIGTGCARKPTDSSL